LANNAPIGFFDSGLGGLSVLAVARAEMPQENFIYFGDNANAPYGMRDEEDIRRLSLDCAEFLYEKGVKAIVVACNTATSIAVHEMRERFNLPVISMEPAVKPACEHTSGKVAVMATSATISQKRYQGLIERLGCRERVIDLPCPSLASMLEHADFDAPEVADYIHKKLGEVADENVTGVVVGCTHYSFVSSLIEKSAKDIFGEDCRIFDGRFGTVRQLKRVLEEREALSETGSGAIEYYSSAGQETVETMKRILASML